MSPNHHRGRWMALFGVVLLWMTPLWAATPRAPHEAVTTVTATETATSTQTDNVILSPASGNALALMGCHLASDGRNSALTIEIESNDVDVITPQLVATNPILIVSSSTPLWVGAADATLTWSTTSPGGTHGTANVTCWGYQFRP